MGIAKSEQTKGLILERKVMMMQSIRASQMTDHKVNTAFAVRIVFNT